MTTLKRLLALGLLLFAGPVAAQDQITADQIQFVGPGGPDLGGYAVTTTISHLDVTTAGLNVVFDKRDGPNRWPDTCSTPSCVEPGTNMGALEYSVGLVLKVNGQWYGSAPLETWNGNDTVGGAIQNVGQIPGNWFYDAGRWGPLTGYQPQPGETVGLFVVAGDARNNYTPLRERSNVVTFAMPADGEDRSFDFSATVVLPPVIMVPDPPVVVTPTPDPAPPVVLPSTPVVVPPVPTPVIVQQSKWWVNVLEGLISIILAALGSKVL